MRRRRRVPRVLLASAAVGLIGAAPTERPEYHEARRVSAQIVQDTLALLVKELGARGRRGRSRRARRSRWTSRRSTSRLAGGCDV
jgi:hypothetical protein